MKILTIILVFLLAGCNSGEKEPIQYETTKTITQEKKEVEITLGEAVTKIIDTGENRVSNILVACEKISGTEINPDEEFSFNNITGRKTEKAGYKNAPVIVDGEKSYGVGGGVCQVSTTIFMAALNANLEITEHHNHSESVAYAKEGMDATVVYGIKDFRFKNNTDKRLYLYVWVKDGTVTAKFVNKILR